MPGAASCPGPGLLVVDLAGDGVYLTDLDYPVPFDLDGDGRTEITAWTAPGREDGFLWRDLDGDGVPAPEELLRSPVAGWVEGGSAALEGLQALDAAPGGDGDGRLTAADAGFPALGIWVDRDHDGVPAPGEAASLAAWGIGEIELSFAVRNRLDGNLNFHRFASAGGAVPTVVEVSFRFRGSPSPGSAARYNGEEGSAGGCSGGAGSE